LKVLYNPAFKPFGGSLVTLIVLYKSPNGNLVDGSHVIYNLKSSWILASGVRISNNSFMNLIPKWQLWRITHPPVSPLSLHVSLATLSYPSPIETILHGYFFFFLANSSIDEVGSAPADSKYKTGSILEDSDQIYSEV